MQRRLRRLLYYRQQRRQLPGPQRIRRHRSTVATPTEGELQLATMGILIAIGCVRPSMQASSQTENRGQCVRHASRVSEYVLGRLVSHSSNWSLNALER